MNEPKRFRKKPIEIEAMQWDGTDESFARLAEFLPDRIKRFPREFPGQVLFQMWPTVDDWYCLYPGWWLLLSAAGRADRCAPDSFVQLYEAVD